MTIQAPTPPPRVVIRRHRGWRPLDLPELWRHRDLAYFLCWRDIKVRYKQTVLGVLWAFLQPFVKLVVFSVVFGARGVGVDSEGFPYPVFLYAGLLPWQFFGEALGRSSQSVVNNEQLVTKVAFPRIVIPLASIGACLVDFAISFIILLGLMAYYGFAPTLATLMIIPLTLVTVIAAAGFGSFIAALNVAYRDFRFVVPFLIQIWMFLTPVIYPVGIFPERWHWLVRLNPMAGLVDGWRAALLGTPFDLANLGISVAVVVLVFLAGTAYFRRIERRFADII